MQEFKDNEAQPSWVIVDGIPDLHENQDYARYATILEDAAKEIASKGSKIEPIVYIPHEKKVSKYSEELCIDGCALIEFGTPKDAASFSKQYRNMNQDFQLWGLKCYTWDNFTSHDSVADEYQKFTKDQFQNNRNLLWWLLEEKGEQSFRDQYVIRYQGPEFEETNVFWMDENQVKTGRKLCYDASELKAERREMTRQFVQWSPNGYYLLTTHRQGVQLWGGPNWASLQKLEHHRVDQMSFSPNETFLITCNATAYENQNGQRQTPQLKIWDVLTGNLIIDVSYKTIGPTIKLRLPGWWPIFKWSHDEKYIAKVNSSKGMTVKAKDLNKINIYHIRALSQDDDTYDEKTRFKIEKLGGKSLTVGSLFNMEFSPTDNILSYTCFAQNDDQSKVTLISIPSKKHLKTQTLGFDVKKAHLYWQSQGRYLAINMAHSQSKKNRTTKDHSIGIMTVKDRNMPFSRTDNLGKVMYFCWEPDGDRFAVIHDVTKREEPNVSIYRVQDMGVDKGSSRLVLTLKKRRCNELYWAPKGGRLVMANVDKTRRAGGELEFVDINKIRNTGDESQTVKNIIHENMTDIQWDPSGRFLLTATTQHLGSTSGDDTRYVVWSFQGDKLFEHKIKYFYQILWRPRPSKLEKLQRTDKQKINHKRANEWDRTFRAYDMEKRTETVNKKLLDNQKKLKLFQQTIEKLKKKTTNFRTQRDALRGGATYSYQIKTIQQRLEKGRPEQYELDKDTMRKILSGEIVDYNKWRNEKQ
eukprot:87485_1